MGRNLLDETCQIDPFSLIKFVLGEEPIGAPVHFLFLHYSFLKGLSWKSCLFQTSVRNPKAGDSKVPVVPLKVTEQILKLSEF